MVHITISPVGPWDPASRATALLPNLGKNKVAQRIKNTILALLPSASHYLHFSHSLEAWCMFAKCSLFFTLIWSINVHRNISMSLIDSLNLSMLTPFLKWLCVISQMKKITRIFIVRQSIKCKSITGCSVNKRKPFRLPDCVCTHGEQITSCLWGVVLWHQRVSLMWLQTSHQAIENIDLSLLTLESIIRAWRAGQIGGKWVKGCLI